MKQLTFLIVPELRFFDKNNKKISLDNLTEKVRLHLNSDFAENSRVMTIASIGIYT
jgi:hypothetical protein